MPVAKKNKAKVAVKKEPARGARAVREKKEAVFPTLKPPLFEDSDEY